MIFNDCPPNKIRNPKTKRCVLKSGKIGKQILANTKKPAPKQNNDCPPNKIRNPKTKRCVLKSGKIGKQILANKKKPAAPKKVPMYPKGYKAWVKSIPAKSNGQPFRGNHEIMRMLFRDEMNKKTWGKVTNEQERAMRKYFENMSVI